MFVCFFCFFQAERILVIGGGAVGVELLGEIKHKYPKKFVTLVHSHADLISANKLKPEFHKRVLKKVRAYPDVKVILEDRVVLDDELKAASSHRYLAGKRTVKTQKGESIDTDLVFFTIGGKPNSNFVSKLFPDKVNEKGEVKVNRFLQVEGFENIFAAGDITNIQEGKQATSAKPQAETAVVNIQNLIAKRPLKAYGGGMVGMALTLGPYASLAPLFFPRRKLTRISFLSLSFKETWCGPALWQDPW